jgi:hypothetical protein
MSPWKPDEEDDRREERRERILQQREDTKDAMREAMKEWLDEKFATFGKWTLTGIAATGLVLLAYAFLAAHGWKAPQ